MDKIAALVSLNELRNTIDELSEGIKKMVPEKDEGSDGMRLLVLILSVLGVLLLIGIIAYFVYSRLRGDYFDDGELDEYFDDFDDEDTITILQEEGE